jgi:hypothetical protein
VRTWGGRAVLPSHMDCRHLPAGRDRARNRPALKACTVQRHFDFQRRPRSIRRQWNGCALTDHDRQQPRTRFRCRPEIAALKLHHPFAHHVRVRPVGQRDPGQRGARCQAFAHDRKLLRRRVPAAATLLPFTPVWVQFAVVNAAPARAMTAKSCLDSDKPAIAAYAAFRAPHRHPF